MLSRVSHRRDAKEPCTLQHHHVQTTVWVLGLTNDAGEGHAQPILGVSCGTSNGNARLDREAPLPATAAASGRIASIWMMISPGSSNRADMLWVTAGCNCSVMATRHGGGGMCCIGLMVLPFTARALLVPEFVCCLSEFLADASRWRFCLTGPLG